jgi:hypothetical protein
MKMIVKLAVLMATLLLLAGVSFAADCWDHCYDVTTQNLDDPADKEHAPCVRMQLCDDDTGSISVPLSPLYNGSLSLFFNALNDEALGYGTSQTAGPACVAYVKFHGDWFAAFKGIASCVGERHDIKGREIDCENPACAL